MVKRYHYIIPKSQLVPEAAEKCEGNGSHPAPPEKRGKMNCRQVMLSQKECFFFLGMVFLMNGLILKLLGMKYVSATRTAWRGKTGGGGCSHWEGSAQPC